MAQRVSLFFLLLFAGTGLAVPLDSETLNEIDPERNIDFIRCWRYFFACGSEKRSRKIRKRSKGTKTGQFFAQDISKVLYAIFGKNSYFL